MAGSWILNIRILLSMITTQASIRRRPTNFIKKVKWPLLEAPHGAELQRCGWLLCALVTVFPHCDDCLVFERRWSDDVAPEAGPLNII